MGGLAIVNLQCHSDQFNSAIIPQSVVLLCVILENVTAQ
jgi:hypothetical protein